ncbi:hypothetical protein [Fontibacter flavus]|uniref:GyrI-like small molecule binding domain-containing protein n=1 Tax=Fontibacter flavus TaxID=654838 RepID=A0ABV6FQG7_9BACT
MKKTTIGLALMFIIGMSLYLFYALGGFNQIEITQTNLGTIELTGKTYRGIPGNESLKETFLMMEELQRSHPESKLHTIYFVEPAGKLDTMEVFVGLESSWVTDKTDLTELQFDGSSAIVANIQAHRFVMPGPNRVKNEILEFAEENKLAEPKIFIDQIIGPEAVKVIALDQNSIK